MVSYLTAVSAFLINSGSFLTADAILNSNLHVPLKGIAIGNGWIDSKHQYPAYMEYALKTALFEEPDPVSEATNQKT